MTEEEAKTKWCPFVRYTSIRGNGINRWTSESETQLNPNPSRCIASQCMAWRLDVLHDGYCGLAGETL